jgi:hypothetical protein
METGNRNVTSISENSYQPELIKHVTECVAVSSICAAPFSNMCSTQANKNSRKLRLRCGCQFPWCAFAVKNVSSVRKQLKTAGELAEQAFT